VGENSLVAGLNNQVVGSDVVLIGHNYVQITSATTYVYSGVEGSPFYIIIGSVFGTMEVVLSDSLINNSKAVFISSLGAFDLDIGGGFVSMPSGYYHFININGFWSQLN